MALITKPYTWSMDDSLIEASEFNANFDTIFNLLNGGLDADNVDSAYSLLEASVWTLEHTAEGRHDGIAFLQADLALIVNAAITSLSCDGADIQHLGVDLLTAANLKFVSMEKHITFGLDTRVDFENQSDSQPGVYFVAKGDDSAAYFASAGPGSGAAVEVRGGGTAATRKGLHLKGVASTYNMLYFDSGKLDANVGSNCAFGSATISNGTDSVTVTNNSVTASSIIFLTIQSGDDSQVIRVGTITAGTSFVIDSEGNVTGDTVVAYMIVN